MHQSKLAAVTDADIEFKDIRKTDSVKQLLRSVRPGDVLLSKQDDSTRSILNKLQGWWTGSRWTHAGLASGKGRTAHTYGGIRGWSPGGETRIRSHQIASLPKLKRDVLVLRPKVSKGARRRAAQFARETVGTPYSYKDWIRAAFARGKPKAEEQKSVPKKMICTTQVAYAYPKLKFDVSRHHLRPEDFLRHSRMQPVLAFSGESVKTKKASIRLRELSNLYKQATAVPDQPSFRPPSAPKPLEPPKLDNQPTFKAPQVPVSTAAPNPREVTKGWRPPAKG